MGSIDPGPWLDLRSQTFTYNKKADRNQPGVYNTGLVEIRDSGKVEDDGIMPASSTVVMQASSLHQGHRCLLRTSDLSTCEQPGPKMCNARGLDRDNDDDEQVRRV